MYVLKQLKYPLNSILRDFGYLGDRPEYLEKRVVQVFFSFQNVRNDNHYGN